MASVTPPSSYVPPVAGSTSGPPVEGETVSADVENLPQTLQNNNRDLSLRGTVVGTNDDGTTRINTPRGPVDVQLPQPVPAKGTEVQVDVPAGTPPRTVTVTLPPPTQTPAPVQQTPLPTPLPAPGAPVPQTPTQQTPVPPSTGTQQNTPVPGQPTTPSTPPPSSVVVQPGPQSQLQVPAAATTATPTQPLPQLPTSIPVPSDAPAPTAQQSLPSGVLLLQQAAEPEVSPQNLLNFLKTSMQAFLKTPALPTQHTGNTLGFGAPEPTLVSQSQRPLQIGQLVRLTPLIPGQIASPAPGSAPVTLTPLQGAGAIPTPGATPGIIVPRTITLPTPGLQPLVPGALSAPAGTNPAVAPSVAPGPLTTSAPQPATIPGTTAPAIAGQITPTPPGVTLPQSVATGPQQFIVATAVDHNTHLIVPQPIDVRVSAMLPSGAPQIAQTPAIANLVNGTPTSPVLFAQVTGQTAQGLPVVDLPTFTLAADGTIKTSSTAMVLQFPARGLGPGSVLKLDILPGTPMTSVASISAAAQQGVQSLTWEALDDILHNTPLQTQGQTAQTATTLQAAMPKPGATAFTAPVLMLVAALRSGDIAAWLGEKGLEAIRGARRTDALARISNDFATTARHLSDDDAKLPGEWKSLNLPMTYGGELNRIQLHYRSFEQEQDHGRDKTRNTGTRFIMDLSLTRMGAMQIDGFSVGKKLDVTLRSEKSLSPPMREALRTRYHDAVSSIGFAGELNFSADADHRNWVDVDDHRGLKEISLA